MTREAVSIVMTATKKRTKTNMGMTFPKPKHFGTLHPRPDRPADAVTGCSVRPEDISVATYGHHRSEVQRVGERSWWFADVAMAPLFRKEFKARLIKGS